jgi:PEP-CTERM motif
LAHRDSFHPSALRLSIGTFYLAQLGTFHLAATDLFDYLSSQESLCYSIAMTRDRSLEKRLARYALLAGAAVAGAKPARAAITYTIENPPIGFSSSTYQLDVNNDGYTDFFLSGLDVTANGVPASASFFTTYTYSFSGTSSVSITGTIVVTFSYTSSASASETFTAPGSITLMDQIAVIGTEAKAFGTGVVIGNGGGETWAQTAGLENFTATGNQFLGIDFYDTSGNQYYGFVEFDPLMIEGFAFNNTPGASITTFDLTSTPEPGTLGMLALGAAALETLRRKRSRPS